MKEFSILLPEGGHPLPSSMRLFHSWRMTFGDMVRPLPMTPRSSLTPATKSFPIDFCKNEEPCTHY